MGSYTSAVVPEDSKVVPISVKPSSPNWIISHVDACNIPILKVQRCWHRFLQMGADRNGTLTPKAKIYSDPNKFVKQVLQLLPRNERGVITFQVYLNACDWFEAAEPEVKLKILFYLMNRGKPVDVNLFKRVIAHQYPNVPQTQLQELAETTVKQINKKTQDAFDEDDFVKWMLEKPKEDVERFLAFEILPTVN